MKTKVVLALLGLVLGLTSQSAFADTTYIFDSNAPGGHGFYNGTGNSDGHFTTSTTDYGGGNTISLSLRGAQRYVGPIAPIDLNDYVCSTGQMCNFEFSVYTTGLGVGAFTYSLGIQDLTTGLGLSFDPTLIGDNSFWTTHKTGGTKGTAFDPNAVGFQNSEFFGFYPMLGYHAGDQVIVSLSALPTDATLKDPYIAIGFNTAAAVPEPSAIVLGITILAFLGLKQLRRRQQHA